MSASDRDLLAAALDAAGGVERWDRLSALHLTLRLGGNILALRGKSPLLRPYTAEISTQKVRTVLSPFGRQAGRGIFTGDSVRIESAAGALLAERTGARAHAQSHLLWDDLDLLYFLGYALWNYANTPFLFRWPGFHAVELAPYEPASGPPQRRLRVRFPDPIPTHCPEQTFYFDQRTQLCRLDYTADIFSRKLLGAHVCLQHREWSGLSFPSHRRVVPIGKDLRPLLWAPAAMEGFVDHVAAG